MLPSNLATSTQSPANADVTVPAVVFPRASVEVQENRRNESNDFNQENSISCLQRNSRTATVAQRRFVTSMRGGIIPEKKGGLPKTGHVGVCYKNDVYVFGGVNNKGQCSNHIFSFEKRTLMWREIRGVGVVPRGRANHAGALIGSKFYIHGGHRQLEIFDDFFTYDIDTGRWEKIACERLQGPGAVFLHSMVHIPPLESLLVLGGVHQREQNIYLGHLFDVRNRVWTGVPPPLSVRPQHLQFVTAIYNASSGMVVILGLIEEGAIRDEIPPTPYLYLFHPSTFLWKRVSTTTAPASPLPFRMEDMWESLLHILIPSGGGVYDELMQNWTFPVPLESLEDGSNQDGAVQGATALGIELPPMPKNKYGFLILDLVGMSWFLVPCNLPRKLLGELNVANRIEREKMERFVARRGGRTDFSAFAGTQSQANLTAPPSQMSDGALGMSRLSFTNTRNTETSRQSLMLQQGSPDRSRTGSLNVPVPKKKLSATRSNPSASSNEVLENLLKGSRYRRLFSYDGAPELMRKYMVVMVRDPPSRSGALRPMQYFLLHGGLTESVDYSMLMFTPVLTLLGTEDAATQGASGAGGRRLSSSIRDATGSRVRQGSISHREASSAEDDYEYFGADDSMLNTSVESTLFSKQRGLRGAALCAVPEEERSPLPAHADKQSSDDDGDDDGSAAKAQSSKPHKSFLLPTLQSGRSAANRYSFALQFAEGNSMHQESLLPYPNVPVAVLRSSEDVQNWSRNYYADQRRWFSDRLKNALTEDRKIRRLRRLSKIRDSQKTTASGSKGGLTSSNSAAAVDSSDDEQEIVGDNSFFAESFMNDILGRHGNLTNGSFSGGNQLTLDAAAAATQRETAKRRLRDFFEEHGLNCFDDDRDLQQQLQPQKSRRPTSTLDAKDAKHDLLRKDTKSKIKTLTDEGTKTNLGKRLMTLPVLTRRRPSHSSLNVTSEVLMTCPIFERLRRKGRRGDGTEQVKSDVFQHLTVTGLKRGAVEPTLDLRSLPAYALLKWSIARLRPDLDFYEIMRRRAQLRWRYLRVLVCTGLATYLLYYLGQAECKMQGIAVSGIPNLLLAPDIHLVGPMKSYRVPLRTVPYNMGGSSVPPPAPPSRAAQMTASGMVVYKSQK